LLCINPWKPTDIVQCDETRPVCEQCTKMHLQCPGFDAEEGSLFFRDENKYASGTKRKPRRANKNGQLSGRILICDRLEENQDDDVLSHELFGNMGGFSRGLQVPVEDQALAYFRTSHLDPSVPECLWSHLLEYLPYLNIPDTRTTLGLATKALALAVFSRRKYVPIALTTSHQKYVQALIRAKEALGDEVEAVSDQFLLSIHILCSYEVSSILFTIIDKTHSIEWQRRSYYAC
jgi:hypothetical protein